MIRVMMEWMKDCKEGKKRRKKKMEKEEEEEYIYTLISSFEFTMM